jgi:AhpD family alkylhydroperoxidase
MVDAKQRLLEIQKTMQQVGKENPDFLAAFMKLKSEAEKDGTLYKKTKKLIEIALSIATRCEWCVSLHVKDAIEFGATPAEIMDTSLIAVLMGGAPSLMFAQNVMKAVSEFTKP